jgi:uncharacterized membrane protein YhaH (DUF805 family)
MNFMDAVKTCFSKFADFNGRAGLPEYWWFALFATVAPIIISAVSPALSSVFSLVILIPFFAVASRRLHDTNNSGWMQLWWSIGILAGFGLSIYGFASMLFPNGGTPSMSLGVIGAVIMLACFIASIYFMVKTGDVGDNQYGAAPV